MVIFQADRKIHEEFSKKINKINKIPPNKRKKKKNIYFHCGRARYWTNRYFNGLNIKKAVMEIMIIYFSIIYNSPFRF
jgi:hypothetical protein